jgi:hypothetical protein
MAENREPLNREPLNREPLNHLCLFQMKDLVQFF